MLLLLPLYANAQSSDSMDAAKALQRTYSGLGRFAKGQYAAALVPLEKSFNRNPAEDVAAAYYYSLLRTGQDLEASVVRKAHPEQSYAWQEAAFRHSLYLDTGPRFITADADAGDLRYAEAGAVLRTGCRSRLWQSVNVVQDTDPARYRQIGTHTSWQWYAGRKWTITATVQTAFLQYRYGSEDAKAVQYGSSVPIGGRDTLRFATDATQRFRYTSAGTGQNLAALVSARKRIGSWLIAFEGGYQVLRREQTDAYQYRSTGSTAVYIRNRYLGNTPFLDSGFGSSDTAIRQDIAQLGLSGSHHFNVGSMPAATTLGIWFVGDRGTQTGAAYLSLWLAPHPKLWVTATAFRKGALPAAFSGEGLYLAYYNPVRYRGGIRVQFLPLNRFSPAIAYQVENAEGIAAGTKLLYHGAYLTLKYAL